MHVRRSIGRTILNGRQPMSFFSSITSVFHSTENTETPVSATFASRKDTVYAPISGMLVDQKEINDEVSPRACSARATASCPSATSCTPRCPAALTW